jgi:two-component system, LytTR family, sensor kinase
MRKSIEVILNLLLWSIITYIFYYIAKTNSHIAVNSVNNYGMFHIPYLTIVVFFTVLPTFTNFYLFYLILIPKLLVRKKFLLFFTLALISSALVGFGYRMTYGGYGSPVSRFMFFTLMALFWGIIGSAVKGIFLWIDSQAERRTLEKNNLMSKNALLMLQAQINPHFLFNSLNNIDILIEENPKIASVYLKKLSDILRYVVYETKEEETDLSKEIVQIQSYIDLQKIRTRNPKYVIFNITGELKNQRIAPMLFIPFIENAFKHSKNKTIENAIDIEFDVKDTFVKMVCKNYFESNQINVIKNEGLGNETIKQRLNLLYPKKHKLIIDKSDHWFRVTLEISLKDGN